MGEPGGDSTLCLNRLKFFITDETQITSDYRIDNLAKRSIRSIYELVAAESHCLMMVMSRAIAKAHKKDIIHHLLNNKSRVQTLESAFQIDPKKISKLKFYNVRAVKVQDHAENLTDPNFNDTRRLKVYHQALSDYYDQRLKEFLVKPFCSILVVCGEDRERQLLEATSDSTYEPNTYHALEGRVHDFNASKTNFLFVTPDRAACTGRWRCLPATILYSIVGHASASKGMAGSLWVNAIARSCGYCATLIDPEKEGDIELAADIVALYRAAGMGEHLPGWMVTVAESCLSFRTARGGKSSLSEFVVLEKVENESV